VSYLYQDGSGTGHFDEATLPIMDGRGLTFYGPLPIVYLEDEPQTNRVNLPQEQRRFADNGTIPCFQDLS
jgi:hypothetical protein